MLTVWVDINHTMASKSGSNIHDWHKLKQDYLASEFLDVQQWRRSEPEVRSEKRNGQFERKTLGWKEEKIALREEQTRLAKQKILEEGSEALSDALRNVHKALIKQSRKPELADWSPKDVEPLFKMLMTLNGLPATITKNQNENYDKTRENEQLALRDLTKKAKDANTRKKGSHRT
jgi:hypothetical protein